MHVHDCTHLKKLSKSLKIIKLNLDKNMRKETAGDLSVLPQGISRGKFGDVIEELKKAIVAEDRIE